MAEQQQPLPEDYQRLPGSERRPSPSATLLGPADENEHVEVTIALRRRPDGRPMPGSDHFLLPLSQRPRMSNEEFASQYGASPEDIHYVTNFVTSHGLTVVDTSAARRSIIISGTVKQLSKAFAVKLSKYRHDVKTGRHHEQPQSETYRGRDGFIHIPRELTDIVTGVFGLDNRSVLKRNGADPTGTTMISVSQATSLYNFPTTSAAGQTIGILSSDGYVMSDITASFSPKTAPKITDISVGKGNNGVADLETTQDICIAGQAAPGAAIAVYFTDYSQKGWVDLIKRVAHPSAGDPVCSVLSSSYYVSNGDDSAALAKDGVTSSWLSETSAAFQDAALQHVTVCIASGDTGTDSKVGDGKAHVQYPASDPWVLSVGGTTIGNIKGTSFDEYVWNDNWGATGGGISDFFSVPDYQKKTNIPCSLNDGKHTGRGCPDVSANASGNSGFFVTVGGKAGIGNGTSASTPLWAGLIAVVNASLGTNVGFVNPAIYCLGSAAFQDIVGSPGPADNGMNNVKGYPAGTGWDACTGWGSPNGTALVAGLQKLFKKT